MPFSPLEEFDEDDEGNPKSDILKDAQNCTEDGGLDQPRTYGEYAVGNVSQISGQGRGQFS